MTQITLPPLPYEQSALEPDISSETLQFHYQKHHQGYVNKLNDMISGTKLEDMSLEDIMKAEPSGKVFNNAAQIWNHTFYWNSMSPDAGQPSGELSDAISVKFGSMEGFKTRFAEVATGQFGSGWAWLVKDDSGELDIVPSANAENPLADNLSPLLVCDVWEHAYYIDYRNDRGKYVETFLKVINWDFVQKNLG
ncbi:MAG: superoxide dismutase [Gammaproteobacteria bacterium]|nr:superoxide dismutase [Gammaproteobacteria bacterium]